MIDDDAIDQYNTEDFVAQNTERSIPIKQSKFISDVKVGNQNFKMIDTNYIDFMHNRIGILEKRCSLLENELRNLKQAMVRKDQDINRVITSINSRFNLNG